MKLVIEIEMDNAAFEPCPCSEVARILDELGDKLRTHEPALEALKSGIFNLPEKLRDINGNHVGFYRVDS